MVSIYLILLAVVLLVSVGYIWYLTRDISKRITAIQNLNKKLLEAEIELSAKHLANYENRISQEKKIQILEEKLKQKNFELAKLLKDADDKNRILYLLREKMTEAEFNPKVNKAYWDEINRMLSIHLDSNNKTFEFQMDEMHQNFFNVLHKQFPDLSVYDLRLCGYIKIGMNSKEIAEMLHVLPSSINVSRSRLRKKLNLPAEEELFTFLNKL